MTFDTFLPDYGILPSAYFQRSAITNPIELFWSDDLHSLLRLCGEREEMIGECASDYDRFLSVCSALPLLEGHPTRAWIASVLDKYFDLEELPTKENAPDVWRTLCDRLFEVPIAPKDLVEGTWLCDSLVVPSYLPPNVTPVLNANLLLDTRAKNTVAWREEIRATVEHFAACGCQKIVLELPSEFAFAIPSVYHVDKALQSTKRSREAENLLLSQLMRELCTAAQEHDLLLVLVCNAKADEAAHLLEYCETSVGLSDICWSLQRAGEALSLLSFSAKPHKNEIFAALQYENVMTEHELATAIESWHVRYPIGRLCFVSACDLRQTPYAQAHIRGMLQKTETKI